MAHHRGRDRAPETLVRLASGPDGLIPLIMSRLARYALGMPFGPPRLRAATDARRLDFMAGGRPRRAVADRVRPAGLHGLLLALALQIRRPRWPPRDPRPP